MGVLSAGRWPNPSPAESRLGWELHWLAAGEVGLWGREPETAGVVPGQGQRLCEFHLPPPGPAALVNKGGSGSWER